MKKILLLTIVSLFLSTTLMAQILPNIGIKGGLTTSAISTNMSETFSSENALGYQFGAFVRINLGKLYIQPEFVYNHRSTSLDYSINPFIDLPNMKLGVQSDVKIGSFDIPVLVGFKIIKSRVIGLRIFAGPEISFATNKSLSYQYTTSDGTEFDGEVPEPLTTDDFNKQTWYLQAGVGVDVLFLTLDVRYEKGLTDIYNGNIEDINANNIDFSHNVWVISLGIKFL